MSGAVAHLNDLAFDDACTELQRCCGSRRWAERMATARPFADAPAADAAAEASFDVLLRADWLEAFAAHPRIGGADAEHERNRSTGTWSRAEQSGMDGADTAIRARLAAGNEAYAERFGYVFLICATGRRGPEMLEQLESRLENDPETELEAAAAEQRAITRLRLKKLLDPMSPITTHILDTSRGRPAAGVEVVLFRFTNDGWTEIGRGTTNEDGRVGDLLPAGGATPGSFRLRFDTGAYFRGLDSPTFYPRVDVTFDLTDATQHHHVPLLLSPFGYSTYRGS